jgi:hypothetical protein
MKKPAEAGDKTPAYIISPLNPPLKRRDLLPTRRLCLIQRCQDDGAQETITEIRKTLWILYTLMEEYEFRAFRS